MKRYLVILGTRPEVIKLAPVVHESLSRENIAIEICSTGQHQGMLTQTLKSLDLEVDYDLALMTPDQALSTFHGLAVSGIHNVLVSNECDGVVVQGDTSTALAGAIAAFHAQIPIVHVEAGLRTWDLANPFPEEGNRMLIDSLSATCAAPTADSADNLRKAGILESRIHVTGNTAIDSLLYMKTKNAELPSKNYLDVGTATIELNSRIITITGHRRESFGDDFKNICMAIRSLASSYPDLQIVYPVHLNPNVQEPVHRILGDVANVHLCYPLPYPEFANLLMHSYLVLTDSGGIQEEAPSLNVPVLVMRKITERPEGITAGCARLVGVSNKSIVEGVTLLLENEQLHRSMSEALNPYGDGRAAQRIVDLL